MIIRPGTLTVGSPIVTNLKRTDDLSLGLYAYADGAPVCSKINTIISASSITLSNAATAAGVKSIEFTTANPGVYEERCGILRDIKDIVDERGDLIAFMYRQEEDVTRDRYESIKKRDVNNTKFNMMAYPVEFSPGTKRLEKAGLREESNVIIYTAMKDWINIGIDFKDIILDTRMTVRLQGEVYEIKEKALVTQISDTYGYITLGLFKK